MINCYRNEAWAGTNPDKWRPAPKPAAAIKSKYIHQKQGPSIHPREARLLGLLKIMMRDWCSPSVAESSQHLETWSILCSLSVCLAASLLTRLILLEEREKGQWVTAKTPSSSAVDKLVTLREPWSPSVGKKEAGDFQGLLQGWHSESS